MRRLLLLVMMAFSPLALGQQPAREQTHCDYLNGMLGSVDYDRDGVENCKDNCPVDANLDQKDGLKYFRYELTDVRYGVLGVSPKRLIEFERIIKSRNSTP